MAQALDFVQGQSASELRRRLIPSRVPPSEVYRRHYGSGVNMGQIENALLMAERGIMAPLTDLENESLALYPHGNSVLLKRFGKLASLEWSLTPAKGKRVDKVLAQDICDGITDNLQALPNFRANLRMIAWALFHGRSGHELFWDYRTAIMPDMRWRLDGMEWINARRLSWGHERELRLIDAWHQVGNFQEVGWALRDYPMKFAAWSPQMFAGYPEQEGLAPRMLYWCYFSRFDWKQRMALTELFALPWRIVEVDKDANVSPDELADAQAAAENLGRDSVGQFPPGVKVQIVGQTGDGMANFFHLTSEDVDAQISKLVLGQTGTTDAKQNRAQSIVHKGEQDEIVAHDSDGEQTCVQACIVNPLGYLNWGERAEGHLPHFELHSENAAEVDKILAHATSLVQLGLPVAEQQLRELSGFRVPENDEPYVISAGGGGAPGPDGKPSGGPVGKRVDPSQATEDASNIGNAADPAPAAAAPGVGKVSAGVASKPKPDNSDPMEVGGVPGAHERAEADMRATAQRVAGVLAQADRGDDAHLDDAHLDGGRAEPRPFAGSGSCCGSSSVGPIALAPRATPQTATPPHGDTEQICDAGVDRAEPIITGWCRGIIDAVGDSPSVRHANVALHWSEHRLGKPAFARVLARSLLLGGCLGALDAHTEGETGQPVRPDAFEAHEGKPLELGRAVPLNMHEVWVAKPFDEAIAEFRSRSVLPRADFDRLVSDAKRKAWTVAGLETEELATVVRDELSAAMAEGVALRGFKKRLRSRFELDGWLKRGPSTEVPTVPGRPRHVETVWRTSTSTSYNRGRAAQMLQPHVLAARPYWQVQGVGDDRERKTHAAARGKCILARAPFWQRAGIPPWGYNCRHRVVSRSEAEVQKMGLPVIDGSDLELPDKGWTPNIVGAPEIGPTPTDEQVPTLWAATRSRP